MNEILRAARRLTKSPLLRRLFVRPDRPAGSVGDDAYAARMQAETAVYKDVADINVLPAIFHYWSNAYLRPMLEEFGVSNPDQFFAQYLLESARACGADEPVFVSIGSGNCDAEVRVALLLKQAGLTHFVIECVDMNPHMLERGRAMAQQENVAAHVRTVEADFNQWRAQQRYAGVMANQSLHHVVNLEGLFDEIKRALRPRAYFVASDMIGRNGHLRWPEALREVESFWHERPPPYHYNRQLERHEDMVENWGLLDGRVRRHPRAGHSPAVAGALRLPPVRRLRPSHRCVHRSLVRPQFRRGASVGSQFHRSRACGRRTRICRRHAETDAYDGGVDGRTRRTARMCPRSVGPRKRA